VTCHVRIVPVRVSWYDDGLHTHASRVVGYRCVCTDHFRGPVRRSVQEARLDRREHLRSM